MPATVGHSGFTIDNGNFAVKIRFGSMTFAQLRTFLVVARTGSVRAAAGTLVVTEPAVSAAVAALGRELGCELLASDGRGIRLTAAGRTMAAYAAELVGLAEQARARSPEAPAAAGGGDDRRRVRAARPDQGLPGAPSRGRRVARGREPGEVLAALRRRDVDLAVGGRPPEARDIAGRRSATTGWSSSAAPARGCVTSTTRRGSSASADPERARLRSGTSPRRTSHPGRP